MLRIYTLLIFFAFSFGHAQLAFQDKATSKGVGYTYGDSFFGGGVSFCDFNNDG